MRRCIECGRKVLTQSDRCSYCRNREESDVGLPPGRWVLNRRTRVLDFFPDDPDGLDDTPEGRLLRRMRHNFANAQARTPVDSYPVCDDCGCTLSAVDERCPGCLAKADRDACRASWRPIYYKPRQRALRKVA